ncbi:MAG: hypothetical protein WCX83_00250 [Candidatus Cloacimonas sp.]
MKTLTTKEAKEILVEGLGITEDTVSLSERKGYKAAIKFVKEWSHKVEFLTFNDGKLGDECNVNIRTCAVA